MTATVHPNPEVLAALVDDWRRQWRDRADEDVRERLEPWSLPLVVRVERADPPTHDAALAAAAGAVVEILTHPEAAGAWQPAVARWMSGWVRKVTRRARASRWQDIVALPGLTVTADGAEVRALLPHPVADPPAPLARLQVAGLDLSRAPTPPEPAGAPALTIAVAPGLGLSSGKACAQVGHAAQLALLELDRVQVLAWVGAGHPLRVVQADEAWWSELVHAETGVALVADGGLTEVPPGTLTAAATFA